MVNDSRIVIIGAGASGIAAGRKLLEYGFKNLIILEAENRIGGRINSTKFGESIIDLGAQWCHGEENNVVYDMVKHLNLLETSKCTYLNNQFYNSTSNLVNVEITDMLHGIASRITCDFDSMKNTKESFGDYFIRSYIKEAKQEFGTNRVNLEIANQFVHWFHKMILCYDAPASWFDMSAAGLVQYEDCNGDPLLNWKDKGYRSFLDILMGKYAKELEEKTILNKEVRQIIWNSDEISINCSNDSTFKADHVIVTLSAGILKEQHLKLFVPQLPFYKALAIDGQGFGTVNKILIKFPHKWWKDEDTSFCFLWTEDDKMNILNQFPQGPKKNGKSWLEDISGFFVIDSDSTTLLCWMVGEFAREVEMLDDKIIESGCMFLLEKFLGKFYEIPSASNFICSRWFSNNHFRGSYSFKSVDNQERLTTSSKLIEPLVGANNKPLIQFAGEATHPKYFSSVHGAVETGFREASRILNYYKNGEVQSSKPMLNSKY
ncbi:PREDICTED: spermine oxidase-like [Nicrophorus vespilloides]|uniref:Spermine oxidase-like n=1 Tax=Nicrophorus vespilloides TaxID=110193 RepID=A0ABM1N0I4_NICVS|nr:PREDICTED: spermine oxidase-like [Nicrophorus vespilloides]